MDHVSIDQAIIEEIDAAESTTANANRARRFLQLHHPGYLGTIAGKNGALTRRSKFAILKTAYEIAVDRLNSGNRDARLKTGFERTVAGEIAKATRLKISTSVWIGSVNIDIFIPRVGGTGRRSFKGLAIEVDGPIHDLEAKMRKDAWKAEFLDSLGIAVATVPNGDVRHPLVKALITDIKNFPRLDTRAGERVFTRIYLETVARNLTVEELQELFSRDFRPRPSVRPGIAIGARS